MPQESQPEETFAALQTALRASLPAVTSDREPAALDRLATLLTELIAGRLTPEAAQARLTDTPELATLLQNLAGRELLLGGALVTFGAGSQLGDVAIGDVAGRDLIKLNVAVTQQVITPELAYDVRGLPNPYRGLRPFTYAERTSFAGRERLVSVAVAQLTQPGAQQALLFVTGASGSGKSSLVQAGLLPALETFYAERRITVRHSIVRPGLRPLAALADALLQAGLPADGPFAPAQPYLLGVPREQPPAQGVALLVLDQFEEVFNPQVEPAQRDALFTLLANLPPFAIIRAHVVATLRADYLPDLFAHRALYDIAKQGIDVRAMSGDELRRAIEYPLQLMHPKKRFEPALVERLAEEASDDPAYLPLLQVALTDLFRGGQLALSAYNSLVGALGARADAVQDFVDYDGDQRQPRPTADRALILALILELVRVSLADEVHKDVRRRQTYAALVRGTPAEQEQRRRLLQDLIAARLLSTDTALSSDGAVSTADVAVDIIHESLIARWPRLQVALGEKRSLLQQGVRFSQALSEWREHAGRPNQDAYLLSGVRLAEAEALQEADDVVVHQEGAAGLIARSRQQRYIAQRRQLQRAQTVAVGFALLALLALVAALLAVDRQNAAVASNEEALRQARYARAAELAARADSAQAATPQRSLLLALEALGATLPLEPPAPATLFMLRTLLRDTGGIALPGIAVDHDDTANLWLSADGTEAAFVDTDGYLQRFRFDAASNVQADIMRRVGGAVVEAHLDASGQHAVTVDADGTVRAWDLHALEEPREIPLGRFDPAGLRIALSADGRLVATGTLSNAPLSGGAWIWDLTTANPVEGVQLFTPLEGAYHLEGLSDDGRWALMRYTAEFARYRWDLEQADPPKAAVVHDGFSEVDDDMVPYLRAISPNGAFMARSILRTEHTRLETLAPSKDVPDNPELCSGSGIGDAVAFDPGGDHVAFGYKNGRIDLFDLTKVGECFSAGFLVGHVGSVTALALGQGGNLLISGGDDGTIRIWGAASPTQSQLTLYAHEGAVRDLRLSADGRYLLSRGADGGVRRWDLTTGVAAGVVTLPGEGPIVSLPNGSLLSIAPDRRALSTWRITATGNSVKTVTASLDAAVFDVVVTADGTALYSLSGQSDGTGLLQRWPLTGDLGVPTTLLRLDSARSLIDMRPDVRGRHLVVQFDGTENVAVLVAGQAQPLLQTLVPAWSDTQIEGDSFKLSADGSWLLLTSSTGLTFWDLRSDTPDATEQTLTLPDDCPLGDSGVDVNAQTLVIYGFCGLLWRIELSGERRQTELVIDPPAPMGPVQLSRDGRWFAIAREDSSIAVWDLTQTPLAEPALLLIGHTAPITAMGFSVENHLVTISSDGTRVWQLDGAGSNQTIAIAPPARDARLLVAPTVSIDGSFLIIGREVWILDPALLVERACRSAGRNLTKSEWSQVFGAVPYRQTCQML